MNGEQILIRSLSETELPALLKLEAASYALPWTAAQFREELTNPAAMIDVCLVDRELCGYHCYWLIAGEMQILNLATAPHWRRRGIAAALLEHAFAGSRQRGLYSAWLEVRRGNHQALALYQRSGFTVEGVRKAYYHDGEDALLMTRQFV